eukprot:scaffold434_cov358-Prasinococcus_capsulatus_cf.AAC.23
MTIILRPGPRGRGRTTARAASGGAKAAGGDSQFPACLVGSTDEGSKGGLADALLHSLVGEPGQRRRAACEAPPRRTRG